VSEGESISPTEMDILDAPVDRRSADLTEPVYAAERLVSDPACEAPLLLDKALSGADWLVVGCLGDMISEAARDITIPSCEVLAVIHPGYPAAGDPGCECTEPCRDDPALRMTASIKRLCPLPRECRGDWFAC
jgi:hypothetical protein